MNLLHDRKLSQAASDLIQFDADSIRQIVSAQHLTQPDVWLADPDLYERHIATPAGVDLESLFPDVTVVRTDRRENVRLHRELAERVAQGL